MLFYVVVYDLPCDKRRKKVADLLEGYGQRVQYSVFECILTKAKYDELRQRLKKRIKEEEDSVRFYPLSGHTLAQVEIWGQPPLTKPPSSLIV
ncbi:MAG: CRISPR-associated endonuclease Cas2 [Hydrococcus sp. C42_A2020_068]|uniref:CRISPR-associated endonuclease Cas2 n=1 Tax=Pleurocapsa sp. PCC 7327 TaxID=118163 RepID=UPI00029FDC95|nr:CRISPR-associated endonuclease Cas2 [Pleurocapsa sp. PCC 7327]AFY77567.1 CRISPR-associated endoribonuclease Cas2 [Pleurocapsa sp. PCC 7327]MBF2019464.1 CRISPR-associated endonuclease Cas2 [Hydrococcus sp. C42_A2020_068]